MIQIQPIMQLVIVVQNQHAAKTCGLCGNFNGNQADDFMKQSGVLEATPIGFVNSWKTCATCPDIKPVLHDPCGLGQTQIQSQIQSQGQIQNQNQIQNKIMYQLKDSNGNLIQNMCTHLLDKDLFGPCHSEVCPKIFYQRCIHDACSCANAEDCMCAAVSSYVYACSAAGVHISGWREKICGKYTSCPAGMVYCDKITTGPKTCRCRSSTASNCNLTFLPLDGCICAPGTYLDDSGNCVPPQQCPCYHEDMVVPPGQTVTVGTVICTCTDGAIVCSGVGEPPVECIPPMVYFNCNEQESKGTVKGTECARSCSTMDSDCVSSGCVSGCMCPQGMVSDDNNGCIKPELCPCIHNGVAYSPGQNIKVDCNTCTCMNRLWVCTKIMCDSTCTVYGNGHYQTFDNQRFTFDGNCEYILAQDYCGKNKDKGTFRVVAQKGHKNPYGSGGSKMYSKGIKDLYSGPITFTKIIKIFLQGSELILTQGDFQVLGSQDPFHFSTLGLYLVVETSNGLTLIWDRKTLLFIKLSPIYKGNVCGLCGNYDGNANNDMTTRCGATVINPLVFGNSWKDSPDCPDITVVPSPCMLRPHQLPWANEKCSIIHSLVFSTCHSNVDPTPYFDMCVFDTCSCDPGAPCESLCSAVAAYAEASNQAGVCVDWRTPDFCPISCDYKNSPECMWKYKACGAPCMMTCKNPSGLCSSNLPPLEGCYPNCPPARPYYDEIAKRCVTKDQCGCYDKEGTHFNNGDTVSSSHNCYVCVCDSTIIQCHYDVKACMCLYHGVSHPFGSVLYNTSDGHGNCLSAVCGHNGTIDHNLYPCTDPTPTGQTTTFHFTTGQQTDCDETCTWTSWINSDHPVHGKTGGDDESISRLLALGYPVCQHPLKVECRAVQYPKNPIGQSVSCNVYFGLMCKNSPFQSCLDYEIRMCCPPGCGGTTNTPHTTLSTPLATPTPHCPYGQTMICGWSQWFNLGHPTSGSGGEEVESIADIIAAGFPMCSAPVMAECRATQYPALSLGQVGQNVICNKHVGLRCKNIHQSNNAECLDYEVRFKCCECSSSNTGPTPTIKQTTLSSCHCYHNGFAYSAGMTVYNNTDHAGYCYIGYCNQTCSIVVLHYQCSSMTTTATTAFVPTPMHCLHLHPPRMEGETWKISACHVATCTNGEVIQSDIICPHPEPIVCANSFPPVKVYDQDGCCWHYECQCICYSWGDPHYVTFDGTYYSFHGGCSYWLVKEVFPQYGFSVMISNNDCQGKQHLAKQQYYGCSQSLTIFYMHYKIYMTQQIHHGIVTNMVLVNDKAVVCAYQTLEFRIITTGINIVLVIPKIKVQITYSGLTFSVNLPFSLFGSNTQGQCGKCDNNPANDCNLPSNPAISSCPDMAHEWHTNHSYCPPPPPPTPTPTPPPHCDISICNIIKSNLFEPCHSLVNYLPFFIACRSDVCNAGNPRVSCRSLQMYGASCAAAGVCIDWRGSTHGLCDYTCAPPKVYDACGPAVEPTCDSWFNQKFIYNANDFTAMTSNKRLEGCYCPKGTMLLSAYSNECVPSCEICRLPNGKWKKPNESWIEGCDMCHCDEDTLQVVCQTKLCPPPLIVPCEHHGQVIVTDIVDCCPRHRCECDKSLCNSVVPLCPPGMKLSHKFGVCCDTYICVSKDVCVFNNHEYQVGETIPRGPCEKCVCGRQKMSKSSLHVLECVSVICDSNCSPGYEYQLIPGQCCGTCVQAACYATVGNVSHILMPGEVWSPHGNPCVKFECIRINHQFLTVESKIVCPPFDPSECIPGTETVASDGCCQVCIPRGNPCTMSSTLMYLETKGCISVKPVNMTSCNGTCGSFTNYCSHSHMLKHSCACCRETSTSQRAVQMKCKDGSHISYLYTHIDDCACLRTSCSDQGYDTKPTVKALPYTKSPIQKGLLWGR
uniref:Uncharacterized protein n=1 Tax=Knipowitschia caucasica TaxID=637954 RepID=A0AAV2LMW6_KNICA